MRLIERIAVLLASIVAKGRAGLHFGARADSQEKTRRTIGMGLRDVRRLLPEAVSQLLESSGGLRYGRAKSPLRRLFVAAAAERELRRGFCL
jgi:hypothetical protein